MYPSINGCKDLSRKYFHIASFVKQASKGSNSLCVFDIVLFINYVSNDFWIYSVSSGKEISIENKVRKRKLVVSRQSVMIYGTLSYT